MDKGDKIIWDSLQGYDIGIYEKASSEGEHFIKLLTGRVKGATIVVWGSELKEYNEHNVQEMIDKYSYDKRINTKNTTNRVL